MTDSFSPNSAPIQVVLLDVMDTLVKDPFFWAVPHFHNMKMADLTLQMDKEAWFAFERGEIDEAEYEVLYFKDRRTIDLAGIKDCMKEGYAFIEGVESILMELQESNVEVFAVSNYPKWWEMIEDKLQLSRYLDWQFMSCKMGIRKPAQALYLKILQTLDAKAAECVFVDDRAGNCEGARAVGMHAVDFKNANELRAALTSLGVLTAPLNAAVSIKHE